MRVVQHNLAKKRLLMCSLSLNLLYKNDATRWSMKQRMIVNKMPNPLIFV
jgi:hypothetical protein